MIGRNAPDRNVALDPSAVLTVAPASVANDELHWPPRSRDRPGEPHCADSLPDGTRTLLGIRLNTDPSNLFVYALGPSFGHGQETHTAVELAVLGGGER